MNNRNKRTWSCVLLAVIFNLAIAQESSETKTTMRVMSFNVLHGATTEGTFDFDYIAKIINDAKPDLVAFQEVDFKTDRSRKFDIATELALRTKMMPTFAKAMDYNNGEYGVALLSKYSFYQTSNHPLPSRPDYEPRTLGSARLMLPSRDSIRFLGTHLDHHGDPEERMAQVKAINALLKGENLPAILAGDFNDLPGSQPIAYLEQCWTTTYDANAIAPTFPSHAPKKKIDYIMVYPKNRWNILESKVLCDALASDHCAYLVELELLPELARR